MDQLLHISFECIYFANHRFQGRSKAHTAILTSETIYLLTQPLINNKYLLSGIFGIVKMLVMVRDNVQIYILCPCQE